jgi:hypothetical protein
LGCNWDVIVVFEVGLNGKPCLFSPTLLKVAGQAVNVTLACVLWLVLILKLVSSNKQLCFRI